MTIYFNKINIVELFMLKYNGAALFLLLGLLFWVINIPVNFCSAETLLRVLQLLLTYVWIFGSSQVFKSVRCMKEVVIFFLFFFCRMTFEVANKKCSLALPVVLQHYREKIYNCVNFLFCRIVYLVFLFWLIFH